MIFSYSNDSENIKVINIDSDESERSIISQNSQEEAKDVIVNSDDSESPKPKAKITLKKIKKIFIWSNFTSIVCERNY